MDWQTVISLIVVFGALIFVMMKLYRSACGADAGCGTSCSSCPASHPEQGLKQVSLVQINDKNSV